MRHVRHDSGSDSDSEKAVLENRKNEINFARKLKISFGERIITYSNNSKEILDCAAYGAAFGGHEDYANSLISRGADINVARLGAHRGKHHEYENKLKAQGASDDFEKKIAEAAVINKEIASFRPLSSLYDPKTLQNIRWQSEFLDHQLGRIVYISKKVWKIKKPYGTFSLDCPDTLIAEAKASDITFFMQTPYNFTTRYRMESPFEFNQHQATCIADVRNRGFIVLLASLMNNADFSKSDIPEIALWKLIISFALGFQKESFEDLEKFGTWLLSNNKRPITLFFAKTWALQEGRVKSLHFQHADVIDLEKEKEKNKSLKNTCCAMM